MKIVLINSLSEPETIEVDESTDFETFEMIAGSYVNIDPFDLRLLKDGQVITADSKATLNSIGIKNGDVFMTMRKTQTQTQNAPIPSSSNKKPTMDFSNINVSKLFGRPVSAPPLTESEQYRRYISSLPPNQLAQMRQHNPRLMDNLQNPTEFAKLFNEQKEQVLSERRELQKLYASDIMDIDSQRRIEELIHKQNIDAQMEQAMEHNPEAFAQTTMLYINCKVNKENCKAFVDSGAQMTFISESFARKSNMERLIDRRWKGVAKGVGTQSIAGRIHCVQFEINGSFLQISVSVLADQEMDMLIGLDMLKKYQCVIDLQKNVLRISSINVETQFLPENQLPLYARLNRN